MKFRVARHTEDLEPMIRFYPDVLGLAIIRESKGHDGYDGVFLGREGVDWHLEFTTSIDRPDHEPDEDDLLVFYVESGEKYVELKKIEKGRS